jgi:hypothetical protein
MKMTEEKKKREESALGREGGRRGRGRGRGKGEEEPVTRLEGKGGEDRPAEVEGESAGAGDEGGEAEGVVKFDDTGVEGNEGGV